MSKARTTTRKRPRKWLLAFYRPVGEFKNGERKMLDVTGILEKSYRNKKLAARGKCRPWREPYHPFIYEKGRKPKRVTEIQINYPAE